MFKTFLCMVSIVKASAMIPGSCPSFESNQDSTKIDMGSFGGLWYEYAYTADFAD